VKEEKIQQTKIKIFQWTSSDNEWVYETVGISKRFPIKPLQSFLDVIPLKPALSAQ
jgi:hypothetical protein